MEFSKFVLGAISITLLAMGIAKAQSTDAIRPSFSCDKARTLDEIAICSDARLAELDRLRSLDFQRAKKSDPKEAVKNAKDILESRSHCGNDRLCILDVLRYAGYPQASAKPQWVDSYREELIREVLKDDLSVKSFSLVGKRASFGLSSKGVQATLVQIDGVDTNHASAMGRTKLADQFEYCERDPGGETVQYGGRLTIEQCARENEATSDHREYRSNADCRAKTVTLWDGTWRFLNYDAGITWTNPKGEVEQPWAGTSVVEGQFELLCPNTFARIRADALDRKQ